MLLKEEDIKELRKKSDTGAVEDNSAEGDLPACIIPCDDENYLCF